MIEQYAILQHTWEQEKVTFTDENDLANGDSMKGYHKINITCTEAQKDDRATPGSILAASAEDNNSRAARRAAWQCQLWKRYSNVVFHNQPFCDMQICSAPRRSERRLSRMMSQDFGQLFFQQLVCNMVPTEVDFAADDFSLEPETSLRFWNVLATIAVLQDGYRQSSWYPNRPSEHHGVRCPLSSPWPNSPYAIQLGCRCVSLLLHPLYTSRSMLLLEISGYAETWQTRTTTGQL